MWKNLLITVTLSFLVLLIQCIGDVFGSAGDVSLIFQRCLGNCLMTMCRISDIAFAANSPWYDRWLNWTCKDQCQYRCMWYTVEAFQNDSSPIPQFYGKWPFIKSFGIQEPASVIFSLLNLASHFMIFKFRQKVSSSAPMYWIWHLYALVAVNAWIQSIIFHTRDFPITEMLDYFSATLLVLMQMYVLICRIIGTERKYILLAIAVALTIVFRNHCNYLAYGRFDYGYNMKAMVGIGVVNSIGWYIWCYIYWKKQPYVWKCAVSVFFVNILMTLELWDFPPIWWTFDAHSLWHAGTSPIALLWYSFAIDDCLYLLKKTNAKKIE